ncbi:hypothetical protein ACP26L_36420 (plasmid) [Paenibacillus sp. S-38]|uniref:hypothetical protein n=1 Tax=Paenibacillus sp. S-38 TaxID=3416710 RepID=UPI003CF88165
MLLMAIVITACSGEGAVRKEDDKVNATPYSLEIVESKTEGNKIVATSKLKNKSGTRKGLLYGESLIELQVEDEKEKLLTKKSKSKAIGHNVIIQKDGEIEKTVEFNVNSPGKYKVWVISKFNVDGKDIELKSETENIEIH